MEQFIQIKRPGTYNYAYSKEMGEHRVKDVQIQMSTIVGKKTTLTIDFANETVKSSSKWVKIESVTFNERPF